MNDQIPNRVTANKDNDLLFRTSMMSDKDKKKKEEVMKENTERDSDKVEYFTE